MDQSSDPQDGQTTPMNVKRRSAWIAWFCSRKQNRYYADVDESFIEDPFNLIGLNAHIPLYKETLEIILDLEPVDVMYNRVPDLSLLEPSAELLYGLIHQRYIITKQGMIQMYQKYRMGDFGKCPRVYCNDSYVLPCGQHDTPKLSTVRLYCPNCKDIYIPSNPRYQNIDGSHFGTTFPHLFIQTFPDCIKPIKPEIYTAKLFGFRINELSESGPRMQWLRIYKDNNKPFIVDQKEKEEED